jgi:hypothetical protein
MIPSPFESLLLALAAYRAWRLLAEDEILDRPRRWLLRLGDDWQQEGDDVPDDYREKWALFLTCPWCAGAHISGLVYLAWLFTLGDPSGDVDSILVGLGVWFALSAAVGLIRGNLDPPDE